MKICIFGNKHLTKKFIALCLSEGVNFDTLVSISTSKVDSDQISGFDSNLVAYAKSTECNIFLTKKYSLNDKESLNFFLEQKFDLGICLGWQRLIPDEVLETFSNGIFGWHGSLFKFPNGRGRSPINWSIRLDARKIYLNFFRYDSQADNGQVYETVEVNIEASEYISELQEKLLVVQKNGLLRLISSINNNSLVLKKQPTGPFIVFPKLSEGSGLIEVKKMTLDEALNIIKSCSRPFPGAFVISVSKKFKLRIWRAYATDSSEIDVDKFTCRKISNTFFIRFCDGLLQVDDFEELYGDVNAVEKLS